MGSVFYKPLPVALEWIKRRSIGKMVVDCGAGRGLLARSLSAIGVSTLAIDLFPPEETFCEVSLFDATTFPFNKDMFPVIARPSHGVWTHATIIRALRGGCDGVLYIGKRCNLEIDLILDEYLVDIAFADAGEEGECIWSVSSGERDMTKRSFDKVVIINTPAEDNCLVGIKDGTKFWNLGPARCPFNPLEDIIVHEFQYDTDDDLYRIQKEYDSKRTPDPQEPSARLGFVSPEGHFFPCAYLAHNDLADLLAAKYVFEGEYAWSKIAALEKAGWAKIMGGGYIYRDGDKGPYSQSMIDTLGKIVQSFVKAESNGVNFNRTLKENPERYRLQIGWSDPDEDRDIIKRLKESYAYIVDEPEVYELVVPDKISQRIDAHPGD